jgi:N-acetylglucosaminyldiphosphoundecaprenol N-acetyl-beta-D-mannosaminyltransferase
MEAKNRSSLAAGSSNELQPMGARAVVQVDEQNNGVERYDMVDESPVPLRPHSGIPRVAVLGVGISAIDLPTAVDEIVSWIEVGHRSYVCVTGVHGVMESQRDEALRRIHNESGLTTPDGMPMVWAGRWAGAHWMERVYGPDLMIAVCERAAQRGWTSFFYGGRDGVAKQLASRLQERFPGLSVVGTYTPPFRPMTDGEETEVADLINGAEPDLVWVGLSTPKQEHWMASHRGVLRAPVLLGVGGAFDIHAGTVPQAPRWIQHSGLEWAFRLAVEPRRLWRRYLVNNPRFVMAVAARRPQLVATGHGRLGATAPPRQVDSEGYGSS